MKFVPPSKIEARELKLDNREFALEILADNLLNSFTPQARQKGLKLSVDVAPILDGWWIGDDFRLQQVLSNLIRGVVKFTEQGQIKITIAPDTESENLSSSSTTIVRFSVEDTGIGLPESRQEDLFQPFTQADNSTTRQYGGTGLGLTICRRIVELMGGKIGVESKINQGSTFWFTVPLKVAEVREDKPIAESTTPPLDPTTTDISPTIRILVVEYSS
ncbi:MAG: ATP-binding protein [Xenococcaceae cyanobacterium]